MTNTQKKRILIACICVAFVVLLRFNGVGDYINMDFFAQHKQQLINFIETHPFSSRLAFIAAYALTVFLAIPVSNIFPVIGGYFFGIVQSTILSVFSATLGSLIAFILFRYLLYDSVQAKYGHKLETLIKSIRLHGANYILFLELLPITPFGFIVIGASLAGLTTWTFIWATAVGIVPSTIIYAYAGEQLSSLDSFGGILAPKFVIPLLVLAILALVPILLRHYKIIK